MVRVGRFNTLKVVKEVDFGVYLDGEQLGTILLPTRYMPDECPINSMVDVFIYCDSEDTLIATTEKPKVEVGHCEMLKVIDINDVGAFMDWGLPKDLLVPYNEQQKPMEVGYSYVVYVYVDRNTGLIAASTKLSHHLEEKTVELEPRQKVDLQIAKRSDLGYSVVIDNQYLGLIFRDNAFRPLKIGERLPGYVQQIRPDGKIDVVISQGTVEGRFELGAQIIKHLVENGGTSPLTDKSDAQVIYRTFKVSKKKYKQALGTLYKQRRVEITADSVNLLKS